MNRYLVIVCMCVGLLSVACGTQGGRADTPPSTNMTQETTSAPQKDGPCDSADARTTINGAEAICMLNSAGALSWQVQTTAAQPATSMNNTPQKDGPCDGVDTKTTIDGVEAICKMNSAGGLSWQAADAQSGSTNQPSGNPQVQVGAACDTPGKSMFVNELYVCKNGKWGYPLPGDLPASLDGSKPDWYPALDTLVNHGQPPAQCTPRDVTFTHSFLPVDQLDSSIPHGAMIYDHVTPIDHAYIGIKPQRIAPNARTDADYLPIMAPADGVIIDVSSLGSPTSHRVVINHGCGVYTVYMVVNQLTGLLADVAATVASQGYVSTTIPIKAGEEFGRQRDNPLDFNVWAADSWLTGFANPMAYIYAESWKPYTADPTRFFTPALAATYTNIMQRTSEPRWGKIDYDVVGSASGNWYLAGTVGYSGRPITDYEDAREPVRGGQVPGKNTYAYGHLAIAPHEVATSVWVFSTGWWQDPAGDPRQAFFVIADNQPTPDQLTQADGVVVYGLGDGQRLNVDGSPIKIDPNNSNTPLPIGYTITVGPAFASVALQVNDDGSLSVELFPTEPTKKVSQLSDQKRTYQR